MPSSTILQLAREGDADAIEWLLNKALKPKHIAAKVERDQTCLQVRLTYTQPISSNRLIKYVQKGIRKLKVEGIDIVELEGKRPDEVYPLWQEKILLKSSQQNQVLPQQDSPNVESNVEANIDGNISGQVAVGNYILQIGEMHGGVVQLAQNASPKKPLRRSSPVFLRPRPFENMIGRQADIRAAVRALQSKQPLEFYGPSGMGKTTLLRHLAYHPKVDKDISDGVVYLAANALTYNDLLQALFDIFHEPTTSYKPTETQIYQALQSFQALVFIDDIRLSREELQQLINCAPTCSFVTTSTERRLWGEGHSRSLAKLTDREILTLVEQAMERSLSHSERQVAVEIGRLLEGNPLRLLHVAAEVKAGHSLKEQLNRLSERQNTVLTPLIPSKEDLSDLSKTERTLLDVLVILGGAPATGTTLTALSQLPATVDMLGRFVRNGIVQSDGKRYKISPEAEKAFQYMAQPKVSLERLLPLVEIWLKQQVNQPKQLVQELPVLQRVLKVAFRWGFWTNVLWMSLHAEAAIAQAGYWDTWQQTLEWALKSAQQLNDPVSEAFAQHQLGVRALCLKEYTAAKLHLQEAAQIRISLDNVLGAQVSTQVLNLVPATVPQAGQMFAEGVASSSTLSLLKGAAAVLAGAAAVTGLVVSDVQIPLLRTDTVPEISERVESVPSPSPDQANPPTVSSIERVLSPETATLQEDEVGEAGEPDNSKSLDSNSDVAAEIAEAPKSIQSCLTGTWRGSSDSLRQLMRKAFNALENDAVQIVNISGYVEISFQEDRYLLRYQDVRSELQVAQPLDNSQPSESISLAMQLQASAEYKENTSKQLIKFSRDQVSANVAGNEIALPSSNNRQSEELADEMEALSDLAGGLPMPEVSMPGMPDPQQLAKEVETALKQLEKPIQMSYRCADDSLILIEQNRLNGENIEVRRQFNRVSN